MALVAASCGSGSSSKPGAPAQSEATRDPAVRRLVDAARQEGKLSLIYFSGGSDTEMAALRKAFRSYYGLDLTIDNTADPDQANVAARLGQEAQAGRRSSTDVYFGVGVFVENLKNQGVVKPGGLDGLPNLNGLVEDGVGVALRTDLPGITYNTAKVTGDKVPKVVGDVLREPSDVRVAATPYASTLAALPWFVGAEQGITYNVQLARKIKGLILCGEESRIVSGEFDMLVTDCGEFAARRLKAQGAPIAQVIPRDLAMESPSYLAIPDNAAHPNAARLWANFLLSRQAQDILWRYDLADNVHLNGSHQAKRVDELRRQGLNFYDVRLADFVSHANLNDAQDCIQNVLNLRFDAPPCRAYQSVVKRAGG